MSNHSDKVLHGKRATAIRWGVALGAMAIVAALMIYGVGQVRKSGNESLFVTDTEQLKKVVSQTTVIVPANMVVGRDQRLATVLPKLRLMVLWPNWSGFRADNENDFLAPNSTNRIAITLEKQGIQGDTSATLERVYLPLFEGKAEDGPAGLKLQKLKTGIGYDNEFIAFHTSENSVWAARCEDGTSPRATCLRDISINTDLIMRVEFSTKLLPHWHEIESGLLKYASQWLAR